MAPKAQKVYVERAVGRRGAAPKGFLAQTYESLTSPENASVIRSVAMFGLSVAFFTSSWSDVLLPAL